MSNHINDYILANARLDLIKKGESVIASMKEVVQSHNKTPEELQELSDFLNSLKCKTPKVEIRFTNEERWIKVEWQNSQDMQ